MQSNYLKTFMKKTVHVATVLLLGAGFATAQQINLSVGATTASLSDGSSVPMWGYTCGSPVGGSTATCAAANPHATAWSPVVIRAVTGSTLQINLTNNLSFANSNTIPTSMMIVGQLGGGLFCCLHSAGRDHLLHNQWKCANNRITCLQSGDWHPSQPDAVGIREGNCGGSGVFDQRLLVEVIPPVTN